MLNKGLLVFACAALAARADLITDCQGSIQGHGPGGLAYQDYGCNVSNSSLGVNFLHTGMTAKYGSLEIVTYGIGSTPDEDSPGSSSTFSVAAFAEFTDLITVYGGTGSGSIQWSLSGSWLNGSTHLLAFAMPETFTYGAPFDVDLGIEVSLSGIDGYVDSTLEASFQFFDAAGNPIDPPISTQSGYFYGHPAHTAEPATIFLLGGAVFSAWLTRIIRPARRRSFR